VVVEAVVGCVELLADEGVEVEPADEKTIDVELLVVVVMLVEELMVELVNELGREVLDDVVEELETPLLPALELLRDVEDLEVDVLSTVLLETPAELLDEAVEVVLELRPGGEGADADDDETPDPPELGTKVVPDVRIGGTTLVVVAVVVVVVVLELLDGSSGAASAAIVTVVQP
jgi:hypothetical protein